MKSHELTSLLLLLLLVYWDQVDALCSLNKQTAAQCHELEDARYIDTYHLHVLRAPSSLDVLTPGNFRNLTSLRHLDLSGGKIETIKSGSFAKLGFLQTLNLADNRISHLEAGAFDGLKHVHSLKLGNNAIRQLPSALMALKEMRLLDISDNPLNCNCATLKLRDALLARGVKISKKTLCSEPIPVKHASILKPDTKMTCLFEAQDMEMQGDQPVEENVEGSGEAEEDLALKEAEEDYPLEEKDVEDDEAETEATPSSTETSSTAAPASSEQEEVSSTESITSSTAVAKDDISFAESEDSSKKETTTETSMEKPEESEDPEEAEKTDDLIIPVMVPKDTETTVGDFIDASSSPKPEKTDELVVPDEGSGESDDDGSGIEGSGLIAHMPGIDFNETSGGLDEDEAYMSSTSSTTTTTTEGSSGGWLSSIGEFVSNLNPWGSSGETTEAPTTTEKSAEEVAKEEHFIPVTDKPTIEVFAPKIVVPDESSKQSPRTLEAPTDDATSDNQDESSPSQEAKKGMGSYVVLAILLAILAVLIGFAAYKGDFCRKKPKRRDVERGTELKDMQKSLLDQNSTQPKIQVSSNGNTLENVPLMNSAPPEEPKDNQRSYDITPTVVTNGAGANRSNGPTIEANDPVKPPRRSANPADQIEAPLNGLNPPMEDIDAPTQNGSNEHLNNGNYGERPPLSPGAQRVKITLQENPDSVPKTPILITRLKGGENLVKAP